MSYRKPKGPGTIHGWSTTAGVRIDTDGAGLVWGARLRFWAVLACVLVALVMGSTAHAAPAVEPWVGYSHTSDLFTGRPLFPQPPGCEQSADWAGVGLTLEWKRTEVDFGHGIKARDFWCGRPWREHGKSGTIINLRYYPLRGRK